MCASFDLYSVSSHYVKSFLLDLHWDAIPFYEAFDKYGSGTPAV